MPLIDAATTMAWFEEVVLPNPDSAGDILNGRC